MCGCECFINAKSMHSYLLSWWDRYLNKLKYQRQNEQNIRYGEINNRLFDTYKNSVISYVCHIYQTSYAMAMSKICEYP